MGTQFPLPSLVPRRRSDRIVRAGQLAVARVRRRNPPPTPSAARNLLAWQTFEAGEGPSEPSRRPQPLILGLTAAWNEEDVIWATTRNLLNQGADEVFVIDDGSSDSTAGEAQAAGATVVEVAGSVSYSEADRSHRIRQFIDEQTTRAGEDVWWIVVDSDEFPRGPDGATIRAFVESQPPWVDTAGSRMLEHVPSATSSYRWRTHPAASIPLAYWYTYPYCARAHHKHQLFRVRAAGDIIPSSGRHTIATRDGRRVREASASLLVHHAPLRDRVETENRLRAAAAGRYANASAFPRARLAHRLEVLDSLYAGRFDAVRNELPGHRRRGLVLDDWRKLVPPAEQTLPGLEIYRQSGKR